jgi:GNAT superfamily N-acetyltransferase
MGLGDEMDLAIFVRDAGSVVAAIGGWTWGDCCELQNLCVNPSLRGAGLATRLISAAEAEAAARGCCQTVNFTYTFRLESLRTERLRAGGSSRGYSIRDGRALVPKALAARRPWWMTVVGL